MTDFKNINIRNKRATFDYEILEEYVAGVVLVGTEIKSIRLGKASLTESYCYFDKGELWLRGMNVAEYGWARATTMRRAVTASCCCSARSSTSCSGRCRIVA